MKNLFVILAVVSFVCGMTESSRALPYIDINGDRAGPVWISWFDTDTWIFDLDTDTLVQGDVNAGDKITGSTLSIRTSDNERDSSFRFWTWGLGKIIADGTQIYLRGIDTGNSVFDVLAQVVQDHEQEVKVRSTWGDFSVEEMKLSGDYTFGGATPVPELATMFLLGSGLLGLAAIRKRIKK